MNWETVGYLDTGPKLPEPRKNLLWLAVDLDGTLAEPLWTPDNPTSEIGNPIWRNVHKLDEAVIDGWKIVIHTSRPWTDYEAIEAWLNYWGITFHKIVCGKLLAAAYIDDRSVHAEDDVWAPGGLSTRSITKTVELRQKRFARSWTEMFRLASKLCGEGK
ncbi:hypothetical protein [Amycolatopsis anabasis]|uniref:hypothetical protein n=1 Tax=Amycolatopsis anabasis TaxID=1840409 RepID=UPI00131A71DA|nr:hypothetical protein [Amycolatopsis anabasis]